MGRIINELQDMTYLSWDIIRNSSGTAGSFLKAYDDLGTRKRYYKLSNYNSVQGIIGHECINEIIADRLLTILDIPHLEYALIHGVVVINEQEFETYLCMSEDFKEPNESKIALEAFYQAERLEREDMMVFCRRYGWEEYIYQMLLVDFLIANRDRHGANIEVLRNKKKRTIRLAPLFDHGLSFVFSSLTEEEVREVDVMRDVRIQSCIGSGSAFENLKLIPPDCLPKVNALHESDRKRLFDGLDDILPVLWRDKIWEMIWRRWQFYESFCSQR